MENDGGERVTDAAYRAKLLLQDFRRLDRLVQEKTERLSDLMESATRATSSYEAERVSGTGERSRLESLMIRKIDLERQLDAGIDRLNAQRYRIQDAIDAVKDTDQRSLLDMRYIDGKRWLFIMDRLHVSEATSRRIHHAALDAFMRAYDALEGKYRERIS